MTKSRVDMQEVVIKPMLMGEFVRHKKQLAPPFNLSEAEALSEWHRLIGDPSVNKSEKVLFNPKSRKEETFTRVHVIMEENERWRRRIRWIRVEACMSNMKAALEKGIRALDTPPGLTETLGFTRLTF
ncbi:unnamed protein product [Effrenium voratum]|uniref:Uncharacterized protein n=1 Tax=Effrenium voratum TaxID=2562239 RepID=A0AA36HYA1_9DINO|nr:unnamed protein product [Effrenium voratum]